MCWLFASKQPLTSSFLFRVTINKKNKIIQWNGFIEGQPDRLNFLNPIHALFISPCLLLCSLCVKDCTFEYEPSIFDFELLERRQADVSVWLADTEQSNTHRDAESFPNCWKHGEIVLSCVNADVLLSFYQTVWAEKSISQFNLNSRLSAHIWATLQLLKRQEKEFKSFF